MPLRWTPESIFGVMERHPGTWRKVAWECGNTPVWWPAGYRLVAVLKDSSRVPCDTLLAIAEGGKSPVPIPIRTGLLAVGTFHRSRRPFNGRSAVPLFALFTGLRTDPVAIEVVRK